MEYSRLIIHTDGAARGNPGPAGAGAVLAVPDGTRVAEVSRYLGETTNNQAEYIALKLALEEAQRLGVRSLTIHADSELMVKQLRREYKVKNAGLKPLFRDVVALLGTFEGWTIDHVRRENNKEADELANEAIDKHFGT